MFKNTLAAAGAVVLSFLGTAAGLAQVASPQTHYGTISTSVIVSVMTELGLGTQVLQMEDGSELVAVGVGEGQTILVGADKCTQGPSAGCAAMGMVVFASSSALPTQDMGQRLALLNQFNALIDSAKFILPAENAVAAARYQSYIHGATRGNIAADFVIMYQDVDMFFRTLADLRNQGANFSGQPDGQSNDGNNGLDSVVPLTLSALPEGHSIPGTMGLVPQSSAGIDTGLDQQIKRIMPLFGIKSFRQDFLWALDTE